MNYQKHPILTVILVMLIGIFLLIAGIKLAIHFSNKKEDKQMNAFYERVQAGKVSLQTYELIDYGYKSDEETIAKTESELRLLKKEGFKWEDNRSFNVSFLDHRGIHHEYNMYAVLVYTDKVDHPVLKTYKEKGVYWNPIVYVPKKEVTKKIY